MRGFLSSALSRTLLSVTAAFILSSCDSILDPLNYQSDELSRNWQHWLDRDYANYDYVIVNDCACATDGIPVVVSVRGDRVVDVWDEDTGYSLPSNLAAQFGEIDWLFRIIDDAISRRAYSVDAQYDRYDGYPYDAFISYGRSGSDDFGFRVVSFDGWY